MRPSRITSYRSFGGNCEAPSKIQVLPRFLSRLKSQVSSRHFYEGQCKAPDVVAREINHVEGLGASPARKAHYPPLVRRLPNLPPRVGGASFALGMMPSHLAKSCDTTVLSCFSSRQHNFQRRQRQRNLSFRRVLYADQILKLHQTFCHIINIMRSKFACLCRRDLR